MTNRSWNEFFGTRRLQAEFRNMTEGNKTPEKGPSLTVLAPERHTESVLAFVAVVIGKLLFSPNTYLYVSQTVKYGRL